jgi:hypothetical protein
MPSTTQRAWWASAALATAVGLTSTDVFAATAKRLGQPISAYSASLFGRTNLSAAQTQTLTCDPDDPLFGSTSVEYDVGIVTATGFGYGPGYERMDDPIGRGLSTAIAAANTPSGAAIEVTQSSETFMMDLLDFLANPAGKSETGFIQVFWQLDGVNPTGKYIPDGDQLFICHNSASQEGVDTHYIEFEYKDGIPDIIPASYRVFDSVVPRASGSSVDFMAMGDPNAPEFTQPGEIIDAIVAGTALPEPAAVGLLVVAGGLLLPRRSRR